MEKAERIFILLSPFLSAFLVYFFAIKGKRKETDIQKEKELNTILSNLLSVWFYLTRIETVIKLLREENTKSIVPKKYFPFIIFKGGFLNDKCFFELDNSIEVIKKYDPLLFFKLEGLGNSYDIVRKKFILPFLKNPNNKPEFIDSTAGLFLNETLDELEGYMETVAKHINRDTLMKVRTYINDHLDSIDNDLVEEINEKFYDLIFQMMPDSLGEKPTFEQFVELSKTNEFKMAMEIPLELIANDTLEGFIELISENPNISIEQIQSELQKKKK
jgi:hypothetical protein